MEVLSLLKLHHKNNKKNKTKKQHATAKSLPLYIVQSYYKGTFYSGDLKILLLYILFWEMHVIRCTSAGEMWFTVRAAGVDVVWKLFTAQIPV